MGIKNKIQVATIFVVLISTTVYIDSVKGKELDPLTRLEVVSQPLFVAGELTDHNNQPLAEWIKYDQPLKISLASSGLGRKTPLKRISHFSNSDLVDKFQVFLGDSDISSLFDYSNNQLIFSGGVSLPPGENSLTINQNHLGEWKEIGSFSLKVKTPQGFQQAEWNPRLEINIESQLDEKVSGDTSPSDRPHYSDVTSNISLSTRHQNDRYSIESNFNLLSVSNREQAIQYGNKLEEARKLDLSDYSVAIKHGNHLITLGHTSYGSNPLLIDGLSRRGISWNYTNTNDTRYSAASLSGSDITGYHNFLGLANISQEFVNSLGFGINSFEGSAISLRIEGTYLDAQRNSQADFGMGEVVSSETNQGLGFRFIANDSDGKLNADLTIALSQYHNPDDLELSQGDQLTQLDKETAIAHNLNFSYQLVQDWQTPWGSNTNLTLNGVHSSAEPMYQTLTAFVQANVRNKLLSTQYQIGNVSGNISFQSSRDNLDNIVNLLTTKTTNQNFTSNIPLAQIFTSESQEDSEQIINWLPSLDYAYQQNHQKAINSPDSETSGFNGESHLPDQLTTGHSLSANWQFESTSVGLQSSHNLQDNRQIGRELSDFANLQHSLNFNWQQNERTAWALSLSRNRQSDLENNIIQYSSTATLSYAWQSINQLALNINYGLTKDDDSLNQARNLSTNAEIGLVKNLIKGKWLLPIDGSISLRVSYSDNESIDNIFQQQLFFDTKTAMLGINLSF